LQVPVEQVGQLEPSSDDPLPQRTAPSLENSFSSLADPHLGHSTSSSARLTSSSKVAPHFRQRNSYIGIFQLLSSDSSGLIRPIAFRGVFAASRAQCWSFFRQPSQFIQD